MHRAMYAIIVFAVTMSTTSHAESLNYYEPHFTGWALNVDNDLFVDRDQHYTGGVSFTLSGKSVVNHSLSVDYLRRSINRLFGFNRMFQSEIYVTQHASDAGFTLFTPKEITEHTPQHNDHPYASLFFWSNSETVVLPQRKIAYQSSFTLGVLGLSLAEDIHSRLHASTNSRTPNGWHHQISAGGEPTARYSVGIRKNLAQHIGQHSLGYDISASTEANLGFTTGTSAGIQLRWGRIASPWWQSPTHHGEYVNLGSRSAIGKNSAPVNELFFYAGGTIGYRLYNALLQGQFRHSSVTFEKNRRQPLIGDIWAGIAFQAPSGINTRIYTRARSSEIDSLGNNPQIWGGFTVSHAL